MLNSQSSRVVTSYRASLLRLIAILSITSILGLLAGFILIELTAPAPDTDELAGANVWTVQVFQALKHGMSENEVQREIESENMRVGIRIHRIGFNKWVVDRRDFVYQGQWYLDLEFDGGLLSFVGVREGERNSRPASAPADLGTRVTNAKTGQQEKVPKP